MRRFKPHDNYWEYWQDDQKLAILIHWPCLREYRVYLDVNYEGQDNPSSFPSFDQAEAWLLAQVF